MLETQPASLGTLSGDGLDDFRVHAPSEVLGLLRRLADGAVLVNLSAPGGHGYTTTLWTVDGARRKIAFSADADSPQLQQLIGAEEAVVVAYLDAVKLQFDLRNLVLVRAASASALQADLPTELFRFQRRATYRVRTLPRSSPTVQLRHPSIPDGVLTLRVLDVSIGGCALALPDDVPPLAPGVRLQNALVQLDEDTRFEATIQLQHVTSIQPGASGVRLGCRMLQLSGDAQRALQRYIDQTQKRRRLMTLD